MKKYILFITLALSLCSVSFARSTDQESLRRINLLVSEYSVHPDFQVVRLGKLGLAVIRAALRHDLDGDTVALLNAVRNVKQITIANYDDCPLDVRNSFASRLDKLLDKEMLLMEAKDSGEMMQIYGEPSESGEELTDLILSVPGDGALIYIRGTVRMKDVNRILD